MLNITTLKTLYVVPNSAVWLKLLPGRWCNIYHTSNYENWCSMDYNVGNHPKCEILCDSNVAYSTKVASKLELQVLCMSLYKGDDKVKMWKHHF